MTATCVIVGDLASENSSAVGLLRSWTRLGHRCIVVRRDKAPSDHTLARDAFHLVSVTAPIESEEACAEALNALRQLQVQVSAVFPGVEYGVALAARLGTALGVRANSPQVGLMLRRKDQQREIAARSGLAIPGFTIVRGTDELDAVCRRSRYPVVLKPVDGAGKIGVSLARSPEELQSNFHRDAPRISGRQVQLSMGSRWLVEEYVPGRKLSVDLFVSGNRVVPVAVSEATMVGDRFVEMGHVAPADLTSERIGAVFEQATHIVRTLGVTAGVVHLELLERETGELVFLEANGRLPGGGVPRLVFEASGNNYYELALHALLTGEILAPGPFRQAVAVHWFTRRSGRVRAIRGWEMLDQTPGFVAKHIESAPGDIHRQTDDGYDRVGYSMNAGPNAAVAKARAQAAAALVSIEYDAVPDLDEPRVA